MAPAGPLRSRRPNRLIKAQFEATPVRTVGFYIALFGFIASVFWGAVEGRRYSRNRLVAAIVVLGIVGFLMPFSRYFAGEFPARSVKATFGDRGQLAGAEFPAQARPGGELTVDLLWLAARQVGTNDKAFVHLVGPDGQVAAQSDSDPGAGFTPTTRWQPGELIPDRHRLALPASLAPGTYRLMAGMYQFEPFKNLLTDPPNSDGRVVLGQVVIR